MGHALGVRCPLAARVVDGRTRRTCTTGEIEEFSMHICSTANIGASKQDLVEAFEHLAIDAGVPAANHAIKLVKRTCAEMEEDQR